METRNDSDVKIPEIRSDVRRGTDERKGAGLGLLAKLGLGGGSASGGAGGFASAGGLLAGKAGIVALLVAGSSVAAGIGLFTFSGGSSGPKTSASLFARADGAATPADSAQAASNGLAPAGEVSGSLDNFHQANRGAVVDPYAAPKTEEVRDSAAPAQTAPGAVPDNTNAPSAGTAPPSPGPHPKMVKGSGFGSASGGSSGASGGGPATARAAGSAVGGGDFSRGATGTSTAMRGAGRGVQRASAISRGGGGPSPTAQLRSHGGILKGNLASGNVSSPGSGSFMDGGGHGGTIGGGGGQISGGGASMGGRGVDSSASKSVSTNLREVEPPPAPDKKAENKTSYQKFIMAAMGAMAIAMIAMFISSKYGTAAKTMTPILATAALASAKMWAGIATAAGAVATGIGVYLMTKEGQMMQGGIMAASGAIITVMAAMAWLDDTAAEKAHLQMEADAAKAAQNSPLAGQKLSVDSAGLVTGDKGTAAMQLEYPKASLEANKATLVKVPAKPAP